MKWIKRSLIIELLKNVILKVGSSVINQNLKNSVIGTYKEISKKYKVKHKGLYHLMGLFGD